MTLNQGRIGVVFSGPMCLKPLSWFPVVAPPHICVDGAPLNYPLTLSRVLV